MKKQKAHQNHIARPNHFGGYIECYRLEKGEWSLRESINIPTNELFDAKIKAMVANGLTDGGNDAKIVVYNCNHSEGVLIVTMGAKKAYELFNIAV